MRKEQFSICEANGGVYITGKCAMNLHQVSFLHVWSVTLQMLGETGSRKRNPWLPKANIISIEFYKTGTGSHAEFHLVRNVANLSFLVYCVHSVLNILINNKMEIKM